MRGGFIHNEVIINPLRRLLQAGGADTMVECPVRVNGSTRAIDLVAELADRRIVIEAECSAKRIESDLEKAMSLDADELWIVVPNDRVKAAVDRKLRCLGISRNAGLFVLTLPQAVKRVTDCFSFFAAA